MNTFILLVISAPVQTPESWDSWVMSETSLKLGKEEGSFKMTIGLSAVVSKVIMLNV